MASGQDAVTTLAPLLFLVVTQVSTVGRDIDLQTALSEERHPLGFPFLKGVFPPLGRFNFVHGMNLVTLTSALVLITLLSTGWIRWGMTFLTYLVLIVLPVLEVSEYDQILQVAESTPPTETVYSFHLHVLLATVLTAFVFLYGGTIPSNPVNGLTSPRTLVPFFPILILLIGISYLVFVRVLAAELNTLQTDDPDTRRTGM